MPESVRVPGTAQERVLPTAAFVSMVGKGMTAREILRLFPEFTPEDIRDALLRAADIVRDEDASLSQEEAAENIISRAQQRSSLSDEEAMSLAWSETRAARLEKAKRSP